MNAPEEFLAEAIKKRTPIYALMFSLTRVDNKSKLVIVSQSIADINDCFNPKEAAKLPEHDEDDHAIDLVSDAEPSHGPLYSLSEKKLDVLQNYLHDNEAFERIRRSTSSAGAPIMFVAKKDESLCLCVDYRGLNVITIKNRHPLPLIDETLDRLIDARYFTKLNLKDAYHRIRIRAKNEWKTAFRTRYGLFEYTVMPFGLSNAPVIFQAKINKALRELINYLCVIYLNDILIYSKTKKEH